VKAIDQLRGKETHMLIIAGAVIDSAYDAEYKKNVEQQRKRQPI